MENIYLPEQVKIIDIKELSKEVRLFRLKRLKGNFKTGENGLVFTPGQFILAGIWGYGEAPFGAASSPYEKKFVDIVVRNTGGNVTSALHKAKKGDKVTFRGFYGNGFPLDFFEGKDLVMATGGCGIPPIASLIEYVIENRNKFGNVYLLYGSKTPNDILMKHEIKEWEKKIKVVLTIDNMCEGWDGHVGFVTDIIPEIDIDPNQAVATMCGPGPMMDALEKVLRPLGISDRRIFASMERKMQCGVGKCQHCTLGDKYVCMDGPVFNFDQIDKSWD
ncbi:MAG: FAD/NAD(P)-binding protein [Candidatus Marinimicrobia bacterium]|nr:FAD/NAD(P)-binding protein [Candidatus Neomarinimicrobiota bacterium]